MVQLKRISGIDDIPTLEVFTPSEFLLLDQWTARPNVQAPIGVVAPQEPTTAPLAVIVPSVPGTISEVQLSGYNYGTTRIYGSNIATAWKYATGTGVTVAVVDDGFDPATTATYANFSTALSRSFAGGAATAIGEPTGGFHGTTTTGMIGASGANGTPMGIAPNATIVGVKVSFGSGTTASFAQAEQYAASVAGVVNNSWGYTGYGSGQPTNSSFASWYASVQWAVQNGRAGLGDVLVFSAGNDRTNANDLAVQPITADYRVIAVGATDVNGTVAYYSTRGAGLLVSAIGNNVAVPLTGGSGAGTQSGTSYSAPTVSAIAALMLSVNPALGWRDVQEILAASAYAPAPSASGFVTNGAKTWNGGGMHFSNDLGFGVVDANVAVNLARAWTLQSTSKNMMSASATKSTAFNVGINATASSTLTLGTNLRIEHVQVSITDTYLPVAYSRIVLIAPNGTQSVLLNQTGLVNGRDLTGGLDVSGDLITSNAFWGMTSAGNWTLQVQDINGKAVGTVKSWTLSVYGDAANVVQPLIYTPEFAALAAANAARTMVTPNGATTIDLIAMPFATTINLNGGAGMIDGVAVTVGTGLRNAHANGSTGTVTLTGLTSGGSTLTGGDGVSVLKGSGADKIFGGLGSSTISTGKGASQVTLSSVAASTATIASGGGDTIWAGLATATITATGTVGDTVYAQGSKLTFINGSGSSVVYAGTGTVLIESGIGGGTYYAGTGGNSRLTAGTGLATFYGQTNGDVLTAGGNANHVLIAGGGSEQLLGGTATGIITLMGGTGTTTMVAGAGKTTFVLGTGSDIVTIGGKSDVIQVQSAKIGGIDTISGFRVGIDSFQLVGFGANTVSTALATQASDGKGGTWLTLSTNYRVDLLGIGKVTSNFFA